MELDVKWMDDKDVVQGEPDMITKSSQLRFATFVSYFVQKSIWPPWLINLIDFQFQLKITAKQFCLYI